MSPSLKKHSRILTQAALASSLLSVASSALAVYQITTPVAGPFDVSAKADDVTITDTGRVTGAGANDGISANDAARTITIDENNNVGALAIQTGTGKGINISAINNNIVIGSGSGITATGAGTGIYVGSTGSTTTNSGSIIVEGEAGKNVNFQSNFTLFTNAAGGQITSAGANGNGAALYVGAATGAIVNSGTIDGNNNIAINLDGATGGGITNNSGGIITSADVAAIYVGTASTMDITNNNGGIIRGTESTKGASALLIQQNLTGAVNNSGTLTANNADTVLIDTVNGLITGALTNSGTISVTDATSANQAIKVTDAASDITGGINNTGTISVAKVNGTAIDLSKSQQSIEFKNAGTVTGDILLSQTAAATDTTFTMTGGTITGNVTAGGNNASTLALTGGTLTGNLTLSDQDDIVDIQSPTISGNIVGDGTAAQILNVLADFSTTGTIADVKTITVQNANTDFTVNAAITGLGSDLVIGADTTLIANADIAGVGDVANIGTFTINSGKTITMEGFFINTGTLANSGTITKTTVDIQAGKGTVTNSGTIDGIDTNALSVSNDYTGDITNTATGTLTSTGTAGATIDFGNGTVTGTFTNAGTINTTDAASLNAVVLASNANAKITGGFVNTGTITQSNTAAQPAIDLSTSQQSLAFTNSGTVTGNVLLSQAAVANDTTFTLTSGTITGNVTAGGNAASTLNLNGGTLTGNLTLSNQADTVNIKSPIIGGNIVGNGGVAQTLNVLDDFYTLGTIADVKTITVQNAGTEFITNAAITGLDTQLTVNADTILSPYANITGAGAVTNEGIFRVFDGVTVTMGGAMTNNAGTGAVVLNAGGTLHVGDYTQNVANDILAVELGTTASYGKMISDANFTLDNSTVQVSLAGTGIINNGDVFTIIDATNPGGTIANTTFTQPSSRTLSFTPAVNGNDLELTAVRTAFANLPLSGMTADLAALLDEVFPGQGVMNRIIIQLDTLGTDAEVLAALETLLPATGFELNQAVIDSTHRHHNYMLRRVEHLSHASSLQAPPQTETFQGLNSGDSFYGEKGWWGYVFFDKDKQKNRNGSYGYDGDGFGLGVGWDMRVLDDLVLGLAFGYSQADYESKNTFKDQQRQHGYVFSLYGEHFISGTPMYLDAVASVTYNKYDNSKTVSINNFVGTNLAKFNGYFYDLFAKLNYDYQWRGYTLTPFASFEFGHLSPDRYTETGAAPLVVNYDSVNLLQPGIGLKVWWQNLYRDALYVPEFHISFQYQLLNENIKAKSHFADISTRAFLTEAAKPAKLSYNLGFDISAYNQKNWLLTFGYDFEGRSGFTGHTANMKLRYQWT